MNEDKLLSHVENLVPGFVTLWILAPYLLPARLMMSLEHLGLKDTASSVAASLFVIAFAYLVGIVAFAVSRFFVDTLSALTARIWLLRFYGWLFDWPELRGASRGDINTKYMAAIGSALSGSGETLIGREVNKRRGRARLIRTTLFPAFVLTYQLASLCLAVLVPLGVVALYSYSEIAVYQEARLATPPAAPTREAD